MGVDKPLVTVRDFIPGEAADVRDVFMSSVHGQQANDVLPFCSPMLARQPKRSSSIAVLLW
ncbi:MULTISPECIES: hypothetical protein [Pseudomonadaceae]|uniref:Uncharacterized protein n=1 Tax=Stutzerimonas balearica TaxID=74829 RepID=A0A9X7YRP0_9GAMM|nr:MULTISPECIES: hypothetical protein [Pseudomonadaceae]MBK3866694.1 hypothetical protein [Stutzerimonas stutzeri]MCY4796960.1 hypothetical protein [Pseudomonas aeruginosa]MDY1450529.1 hypothetical protein [Pseudomonas aeruginosa]MDZ5163641.1 hypothetical protein [Pseudomonas aeruginosa]MDZ5174792.1 hypothetical protein [Pseudomonas aeruginosa]